MPALVKLIDSHRSFVRQHEGKAITLRTPVCSAALNNFHTFVNKKRQKKKKKEFHQFTYRQTQDGTTVRIPGLYFKSHCLDFFLFIFCLLFGCSLHDRASLLPNKVRNSVEKATLELLKPSCRKDHSDAEPEWELESGG